MDRRQLFNNRFVTVIHSSKINFKITQRKATRTELEEKVVKLIFAQE